MLRALEQQTNIPGKNEKKTHKMHETFMFDSFTKRLKTAMYWYNVLKIFNGSQRSSIIHSSHIYASYMNVLLSTNGSEFSFISFCCLLFILAADRFVCRLIFIMK